MELSSAFAANLTLGSSMKTTEYFARVRAIAQLSGAWALLDNQFFPRVVFNHRKVLGFHA